MVVISRALGVLVPAHDHRAVNAALRRPSAWISEIVVGMDRESFRTAHRWTKTAYVRDRLSLVEGRTVTVMNAVSSVSDVAQNTLALWRPQRP